MHACTPMCPHVLQCMAHSSSHTCSLTRLWVCVLLHTRAPPHAHTHLLVHCHTPFAHPHPVHVGTDPCTLAAWCALTLTHIVLHAHPPLHNPSVHTQGCQCACTPTALCTPTSSHILCTWVWTGSATLARVAHPRRATHPLALGHCLGHACTLMHTHTRPLAHPRCDAGPSCGVPPDLINPNRPHWPSQSHPPVPTP